MKPKILRKIQALFFLCCLVVMGTLCLSWIVGTRLLKAAPSSPVPPAGLNFETVEFVSKTGAMIKGWWFEGKTNGPALVLMHGIRGNRSDLNEHARFLNAAGYSVLTFDFQAHGESTGSQITFGYRESNDAQAAVAYAKARSSARVGVVGISLGGAATLLRGKEIGADALVLEMVYPSLEDAVGDRIAIVLGRWAKFLSPILTWQLKSRVGVGMDYYRIIDRVTTNSLPKLFIAGSEDRHTTLAESNALFHAAAEPKEMWVVQGAAHENLHRHAGEEYEKHILNFFKLHLGRNMVDGP